MVFIVWAGLLDFIDQELGGRFPMHASEAFVRKNTLYGFLGEHSYYNSSNVCMYLWMYVRLNGVCL